MSTTTEPPEGLDDFLSSGSSAQSSATNEPPPGLEDVIAPELADKKYGGVGGMAATALESGLSGLTFTGSRHLENLIGEKLDIPSLTMKEQTVREETNPGSEFIGNAAGFGALLALTGGFGGAGAAGADAVGLGAEAAGEKAAQTAIQAGLESGLEGKAIAQIANAARTSALADFSGVARIGSAALKTGIETAIYNSGNEAAKLAFGDPNQTVGSALTNVGLYGLLGGSILGGLVGGAGELWRSTVGNKLNPVIESANNAITEADKDIPTLSNTQEDVFNKLQVPKGNQFLKENAPEIKDALQTLNLKPVAGMYEKDPFYGNLAESTSKTPTIVGRALAKERIALNDGLINHAEDLVADQTSLTERQVGKQVKEGLQNELEKVLKPIEEGYEAERPHMQAMEITPQNKAAVISKVLDNPVAKLLPDGPVAKQAQGIVDDIKNLKSVDDIKTYRTIISGDLTKAYRAGDTNTANLLQNVKDALTQMRETAINRSGESVGNTEGVAAAQETIGRIKDLDARYAAYKNLLKQLGVESGTGNINNARALLERFGKLSDESMATKIFDTNDVNQLQFFKDNFPKQYELARQYKLRDIFEKAIDQGQGKNGQLSVAKFLNQINEKNMGPEAREMLFPGKAKNIEALFTVFRAFPGVFNTSNTSAAESFARLFTPSGLMENLAAAQKLAFLRGMPYFQEAINSVGNSEGAKVAATKLATATDLPPNASGFKAMADYLKEAIQGQNLLSNSIKNLFEGVKTTLPARLEPSDQRIEKLDERLKKLSANPEPLMNMTADLGHYMPDHATTLAQTASNAVTYLNGLRPTPHKANPLDEETEPNKVEKENYHRALEIAEQPLVLLNNIKEGTLTGTDVQHLQNLYPGLHQMLSNKMLSTMNQALTKKQNIPYSTKLSLALFMGTPLDSTMTPQGIISAQPTLTPNQQADKLQEKQFMQKGPHSMKNIGKLAQANATSSQARLASKQGLSG